MAKKAADTNAAAAPAFTVEVGSPPPAIQRMVGGASSPYTPVMKSMPAPQGDKVAQFFVKAEVPTTITDATEREKAAKDEARKISNRISGIARRLTKDDASLNFALRTQKDAQGNLGVRVYRVAAAAPAAS